MGTELKMIAMQMTEDELVEMRDEIAQITMKHMADTGMKGKFIARVAAILNTEVDSSARKRRAALRALAHYSAHSSTRKRKRLAE